MIQSLLVVLLIIIILNFHTHIPLCGIGTHHVVIERFGNYFYACLMSTLLELEWVLTTANVAGTNRFIPYEALRSSR
jgi:hypothetical protein